MENRVKYVVLKHPKYKFNGYYGGVKFIRSVTIVPDNSHYRRYLRNCPEISFEEALGYVSERGMGQFLKFFHAYMKEVQFAEMVKTRKSSKKSPNKKKSVRKKPPKNSINRKSSGTLKTNFEGLEQLVPNKIDSN